MDIANKFSAYFTEKIDAIRTPLDLIDDSEPNYSPFFTGNTMCAFEEVSIEEVRKIIISAPNKSCELDALPTELLKGCLDVLLEPITSVINTSIRTGIVPDIFKKGSS